MPPMIEDENVPPNNNERVPAPVRAISHHDRYTSPYQNTVPLPSGRIPSSQITPPILPSNASPAKRTYGNVSSEFDISSRPRPTGPATQRTLPLSHQLSSPASRRANEGISQPLQQRSSPLSLSNVAQHASQARPGRPAHVPVTSSQTRLDSYMQGPSANNTRVVQPTQFYNNSTGYGPPTYSGHGHDFPPSIPMRNPVHPQQTPPRRYASPYNPSHGGMAATRQPQPSPMSSMQVSVPSFTPPPNSTAPPPQQAVVASIEKPIIQYTPKVVVSSPLRSDGTKRSRGGRPKGSLNKATLRAIEAGVSTPSANRARRGRSSGEPTTPVESAMNGATPRRRGRPFANAEAALKAAEKAARKARGEKEPPKKVGRPSKIHDQEYVEAKVAVFYSYICQWEGCIREFQNFEMLKTHVFAIHRHKKQKTDRFSSDQKSDASNKSQKTDIVCRWGKGEINDVIDGKFKAPLPFTCCNDTFKTNKEWKAHMEKDHFYPFLWHMGEGTVSTPIDTNIGSSDGSKAPTSRTKSGLAIKPWMLNEDGIQVTPSSINNLKIETGEVNKLNKKRWAKEIGRLDLDMTSSFAPPPNKQTSWMTTGPEVVESSESPEPQVVDGSGSGGVSEEPPVVGEDASGESGAVSEEPPAVSNNGSRSGSRSGDVSEEPPAVANGGDPDTLMEMESEPNMKIEIDESHEGSAEGPERPMVYGGAADSPIEIGDSPDRHVYGDAADSPIEIGDSTDGSDDVVMVDGP